MSDISRDPWPDFNLNQQCPNCLSYHNGASNTMDQAMPVDGDVSVCIVCGGIAVYDFSVPLLLRHPNDAELAVIMADPNIKILQQGLEELKRRYGPVQGDYDQPPPSPR